MEARFPQVSLLLLAAIAAYLKTLCVCACLSDQPKTMPERCCKSLAIDFVVETFNCFLEIAFWSDSQMPDRGSYLDPNLNNAAWPTSCKSFIWPTGTLTWTQTWTMQPDKRNVKVLSAPKSLNNMSQCGNWKKKLGLLKILKLDSSEFIPTLIIQTGSRLDEQSISCL